jgi:hypothetical protein
MSIISKLFTINGRVPWIPLLIATLFSAILTASYIKIKRPPFILDDGKLASPADMHKMEARPSGPARPAPPSRKRRRTEEEPLLAQAPMPAVVRVPIFFQEEDEEDRGAAAINEIHPDAPDEGEEEDTDALP